jgi:sarcosine oxidase subunit beta
MMAIGWAGNDVRTFSDDVAAKQLVVDKNGLRQFIAVPPEAREEQMIVKAHGGARLALFAKADGTPYMGRPGLNKKQITDKRGVQTTRGDIAANKVGLAVAGNTSRVASLAGLRLPIESHVLQAFVSEGVKPLIDGVITFGAGHFYVSQSDKGGLVFGGDIDGYNSYAQRGNMPVVEDVAEGGMSLMPMIGRARLLRMWGGIMDMSMDGSPIIDKTDIDGLYFNGGWCYGGFKATPASGWCFAHLLATDQSHKTATAYRFDRFRKGLMIDEKGQGAQPNLH